MNSSQEIPGELVVSGGDPAEVLEPTEGVLDTVPLLVGFLVEAERLLAVGPVGNDRLGAATFQPLPQWCAVIGLVAEQFLGGLGATDKASGGRTIVRLTTA